MFWLDGFRLQSGVPQGVKLICDKRQHLLATLLLGVATIAIVATELFVLIVHFSSCVTTLVSVSDHLADRSRPSPESGWGLGTQLPLHLKMPGDRQHRVSPSGLDPMQNNRPVMDRLDSA